MEILYIASSVLSLFFVLILLGKKNKSFSDSILICWFLLLFSNVFIFYLIIKDLAPPVLVDYLNNSVFIQGPLLFFYTSSLTGNLQKKITSKKLVHFVPFLIFFLISIRGRVIDWIYLDLLNYSLVFLKFIITFLYIVASIKTISLHRKRIAYIFSNVNEMELKWLSSVLYGGIILMIFGIITLVIHYFTPIKIPQYGGKYLNIAYSISIILLGYFGFRQTPIFTPSQIQENKSFFKNISAWNRKNNNSTTNAKKEQIVKSYSELLDFMETNKPYLDKTLTLFKLAEQLKVSENKLSHIINSQSHLNFFEFVNMYRVEMVKSKMQKGEQKQSTLLGLAYDSGFNSKASFNRAFKKFTGLTPSQYQQNFEI